MAFSWKPSAAFLALKLPLIAHVLICLMPLFFQSLYSFSLSPSPSSPFSFLSNTSTPPVQKPSCYPLDRDALQEVAASWSHSSSSARSFFGLHWTRELDCCSWMGVTCSSGIPLNYSTTRNSTAKPKVIMQYSRVVGLNLNGMAEFDDGNTSIPLAIFGLSALTSLDLSFNKLSGSLPPLKLHMPRLQYLALTYNSLSGSISFINGLSSLQHLDLSNNFLSGSISFINGLSSLQHLDLSSNSLSGSISFISGLSNLQYLDLSSNDLNISLTSDAFSTSLHLQFLDLSSNMQTSGDICSVELLQHLQTLTLTMFDVPASCLGRLFCKLRSLQSLSVSGQNDLSQNEEGQESSVLNDKLRCEKPASVNLTYLVIEGQGYTGPFPAWFANFPGLQNFDLGGNHFEGSIPHEWPQALTQLSGLSLSGDSPSTPVPLSQEVQSWLFRLPLTGLTLLSMGLASQDFPCAGFSLLNHTMQVLNLGDNHISIWPCLQLVLHNFSSLVALSLAQNPLAMRFQPQHISQSILVLDLNSCQLSGSLPRTLEKFPFSDSVSLAHNNLTGSIPSYLGNVGFLDLSDNELTGPIPSSVWNLTEHSILILDNNNLHGEVASNQGVNAYAVSLANNFLSKASFHNVSFLVLLDLSGNQLQGSLEDLLGDHSVLRSLKSLILYSNQLSGSIPNSLGTSAPSLMMMDLSHNNLTGAVPNSLQHLKALHSKLELQTGPFLFVADLLLFPPVGVTLTLESVKNVNFNVSYFRGHLDLSSNQLSGSIPDGLGAYLVGLNDLNLSRNQLSGPIPPSLARLHNLESLDLSSNHLQGFIPQEFRDLTSLEVFNVSFNPELSGEIPEGPQFETATSYEGDPKLCGQAINRDCGGQSQAVTPTGESNTQKHEKLGIKLRKWIEEWVAIPAIFIGYVLGMALTIWVLKMLGFYK